MRMLEEQRGDGGSDLVAAADRCGRELELTVAPVEETHQSVLGRAVTGARLTLEDLALRDEHPRDLAGAQEEQDARFALELEQREQRAETDVDEVSAQA